MQWCPKKTEIITLFVNPQKKTTKSYAKKIFFFFLLQIFIFTYLDRVELFDRLKFGRGISSKPRCTDTLSNSTLLLEINWRYSGVCNEAKVGFLYVFSMSDEQTTETELIAIAADAIHGCNMMPNGLKTPAASGIPSKLYILANRKFRRIRRTVRLDRSKHATTSSRSF